MMDTSKFFVDNLRTRRGPHRYSVGFSSNKMDLCGSFSCKNLGQFKNFKSNVVSLDL